MFNYRKGLTASYCNDFTINSRACNTSFPGSRIACCCKNAEIGIPQLIDFPHHGRTVLSVPVRKRSNGNIYNPDPVFFMIPQKPVQCFKNLLQAAVSILIQNFQSCYFRRGSNSAVFSAAQHTAARQNPRHMCSMSIIIIHHFFFIDKISEYCNSIVKVGMIHNTCIQNRNRNTFSVYTGRDRKMIYIFHNFSNFFYCFVLLYHMKQLRFSFFNLLISVRNPPLQSKSRRNSPAAAFRQQLHTVPKFRSQCTVVLIDRTTGRLYLL